MPRRKPFRSKSSSDRMKSRSCWAVRGVQRAVVKYAADAPATARSKFLMRGCGLDLSRTMLRIMESVRFDLSEACSILIARVRVVSTCWTRHSFDSCRCFC